jgi:heat shock protein HtpX
MTLLTMIVVIVGRLLGGTQGMFIALGIGMALNLGNYWFSSTLILKAYRARILEPGELQWLQDDVREMAERGGMPVPKVALVPKAAPNAFATGRNPQNAVVAVTQGLLDLCSPREVRAVMAHELGHVRHRDMLTMTLVAGAVSAIAVLGMMARFGAMFGGRRDGEGGNPFALIIVSLVASMVAGIVQAAISRAREFEADRGGAELCGDPDALADALARLHSGIPHRPPLTQSGTTAHMMIANPFFGSAMAKMFATHPDPQERIARLRAMA